MIGSENPHLLGALGRFQPAAAYVAIGLLAWTLWTVTAVPVDVNVDGVNETVITHRRTLGPLLADLGLDLHEADRFVAAFNTAPA
ncbi:MAG: hypothetical protein R2856_26455 [Caldilineaceae bacterium]